MQFHYDKSGCLGRITLVNPPYGAIQHPVFADILELKEFFADPGLKAVTVKGKGRHFCSGADPDSFKELFGDTEALAGALAQGRVLLDALCQAPLPVMAIICGSCLGGGLELALACHFRFAASSSMLGFPECVHGLMPGMGGTIVTQRLVGRGQLMELILNGRMIGAEEALNLGLVDHVTSVKTVEEEALRFLDALTAKHSTTLIRTVMQSINNGFTMKTEDALVEETRLFCQLATAARSSSKS